MKIAGKAARRAAFTLAEVTIPREGWKEGPQKQILYRRILERHGAIPGVQSAALSNLLPLAAPFENRFWIAGQPEGNEETAPKAGLPAYRNRRRSAIP